MVPGDFEWTAECNFTCKEGFYKNQRNCSLCSAKACPPYHARAKCPAGSTQDAPCQCINGTCPLLPMTATVTVRRPYAEVCQDVSTYVDGFCQGLRGANPSDTFACVPLSIDGMQCPRGKCTCKAQARRLLQDSCVLVMSVVHTFPAQPVTEGLPTWAERPVIVPVQEEAKSESSSNTMIYAGGGAAAVALIVLAIVMQRARGAKSTKEERFSQVKIP